MACVNINSKEFKDCCSRLNISTGQLENIVHSYTNTEGNEDSFPSDSYILSQVEGSKNEVSKEILEDATKLWEQRYKEPIVVNTDNEAQSIKNKVLQFFDESAIGIKESQDGKYTVTVQKPQLTYEERLQEILDNAPRDEQGRLLAPNGKPTNLTDRQYAQVRTKEFKDWFGDWESVSKIYDSVPLDSSKYYRVTTISELNNAIKTGKLSTPDISMFDNAILNKIHDVANISFKELEILNSTIEGQEKLRNIWKDNKISPLVPRTKSNHGDIAFQKGSTYYKVDNAQEGTVVIVNNNDKTKFLQGHHGTYSGRYNDDINVGEPVVLREGFEYDNFDYYIKTKDGWKKSNFNVSKVVDENGEPLVVYHGSNDKFETFDINKKRYNVHETKGFWFTDKKEIANEHYGDIIYEVFLNIKNMGISKYKDIENLTFAEIRKYEDNLLQQDNDGAKLETIDNEDDEIQYFVKTANQIKSATDNIGTFSTKDDNIYHNKDVNGIYNILDVVSKLKHLNGDVSRTEYLSKFNEQYYLPKEREDEFKNYIVKYLENINLPVDLITYKQVYSGRQIALLNEEVLNDVIERNDTFIKMDDLFEGFDTIKPLLNFLSNKTGLNYKIISEKEASKFLKKSNISDINAFVVEDTCYFIEGRKLNTDIVAEEMLHPFIASIKKLNNQAFKSLLRDAETAYPKLRLEIDNVYKSNKDEELVTQALSRAFREDIQNTPEGNDIKTLLKHFINYIVSFFTSTFGENNSIITVFTRAQEILDKKSISAQDLKSSISIQDLAKIVNSELQLRSEKLNRVTFNQDIDTTINHTPIGKQRQTYTIKGSHIYNKEGIEVFKEDSVDRNKIFANLAVKQGRAVVINHKDTDYVVNNRQQIISTKTGKIMQWGEENGDRKAVLSLAKDKFSNNQSTPKYYEGNIIPDANTVFVFGSNPKGIHGAGAARTAAMQFGAQRGVGEGLTGNAYALPTKDLDKARGTRWYHPGKKEEAEVKEWYKTHSITEVQNHPLNSERTISPSSIIESIKKLYEVVKQNPTKQFKVSNYPIGQLSLNGYLGEEMIQMFKDAGSIPSNIVFSKEWINTGMFNNSQPQISHSNPSSSIEINSTEKTQLDNYHEQQLEQLKQLDALQNSDIIKVSEIREIAEECVYWICDLLTQFQNNPKVLFDNFPNLRTLTNGVWTEENQKSDIDKINNKSRADIVRFIGGENLLNYCKDSLFTLAGNENLQYVDDEMLDQANLIEENFKAVMTFASDVFASIENFSLSYNIIKDIENVEVNENVDSKNEFDELNQQLDEDTILENEGNLQEHWQVEFRTIDTLSSMSQLVKQVLNNLYIVDNQGNKVLSKRGVPKRVKARDATNSILRWAQNSLTLEDIIANLENKVNENPWLQQLIDKLNSKDASNVNFKSQFASVFLKHFQTYYIVSKDKKTGKLTSIPINEYPALKEVVSSIQTLYKIGLHPMFTSNGINETTFNTFKEIVNSLNGIKWSQLTSSNKETVVNHILDALTALGYNNLTFDEINNVLNDKVLSDTINYLQKINNAFLKELDNPNYNPFDYKSENGINGNLRQLLKPFVEHLEDIAISCFYENGKMYQSYVTPSYLTKLIQKFHLKDAQKLNEFLENEYGQYDWFRDTSVGINSRSGNSSWRCPWLYSFVTNIDDRNKLLQHKVQLNYNKHSYMKGLSDTEYTMSLIAEYFANTDKNNRFAWYRIPIMSNKPSSEFIQFYKYTSQNYKNELVDGFKMIFYQELSRIQTVEMRNLDKSSPDYINNFDSKGKKFQFLSFLNTYLNNQSNTVEVTFSDKTTREIDLSKLLHKKLNGENLTNDELYDLDVAVGKVIFDFYEQKSKEIVKKWKETNVFEASKKLQGLSSNDNEREQQLINFIWNDSFASMNILELTITDIAYYKNTEDLQKRLAQIHAPGIRGYANITDYSGKPVSDGKLRVLKLTDFDSFVSNIIDNLNEFFDKKIAESKTENERKGYEHLKDSLTRPPKTNGEKDKGGAYWQINVADAQAFTSPTSYRKKALMFGKWDTQKEATYQKLINGNYTYTELETTFGQALKPFVYTQISKQNVRENTPLKTLKVGLQYKNSEYLLIMADAMLKNENTGKPNLLRALYEVMEESSTEKVGEDSLGRPIYQAKTNGIDVIQFESAVKTGLQGRIDINSFYRLENGEKLAKEEIERCIYKTSDTETTSIKDALNLDYNTSYVDIIPIEDYCLQQEVPEHFLNHHQAFGSQDRAIIPSDLVVGEVYEFDDNGEHKSLSSKEFKQEWERTISDNIQQDLDNLAEELFIGENYDRKSRNIALSKILQSEIKSSPRYGIDLYFACSVDENGNFRIPLGDPIQSKRIEQLINSIVKNRINKQTIAGGPVVQVTNFGTSKELNIRFKDKNGNLLMSKTEFAQTVPKNGKQYDIDAAYKKYIDGNQAGIAYYECFAPMYMKELFYQFRDKDGNIDIDKINKIDPKILDMVGYRI